MGKPMSIFHYIDKLLLDIIGHWSAQNVSCCDMCEGGQNLSIILVYSAYCSLSEMLAYLVYGDMIYSVTEKIRITKVRT